MERFIKTISFLKNMGSHSGRPYLGQRPGADKKKISKEIRRGRKNKEASKRLSIDGQITRLDDLQRQVGRTHDPYQLEQLYMQYANLAAGSSSEVFIPDKIRGIVKYSDLADQDGLALICQDRHYGTISDFLPLHHLVKLLDKTVPDSESEDKFIYLLGSTTGEDIKDPSLKNLRSLEYALATFSERLRSGQNLDLEIDKHRVQVPWHDGAYYNDHDEVVGNLRRQLGSRGVGPATSYRLRRIKSGPHKVSTNLYVVTEQKILKQKGLKPKNVLVSYLTNKT